MGEGLQEGKGTGSIPWWGPVTLKSRREWVKAFKKAKELDPSLGEAP
jgi:hypothetical protein